MIIDLNPTIVQLGPFTLTWQGLALAAGLGVAVMVAARLLRAAGLDPAIAADATVWVVPAGLVGARLLHVFSAWNYYAVHPLEIPAIERGGASAYGAILFGTLAGLLFARRRQLPLGAFFDASAPAQAIGLAIGRLGDLAVGASLGRPTTLFLAVKYLNPAAYDSRHVFVHPVAAYEAAGDLALFLVLLGLRRRRPVRGTIFWAFTGLYGLERIGMDFLRDTPPDLGPFSQDQLIGIGLLILSIGVQLLRVFPRFLPFLSPRGHTWEDSPTPVPEQGT